MDTTAKVSDDCQVEPQTDDNLPFFMVIDDSTKKWLENLHLLWASWKKSQTVTQTLFYFFDTAQDPYESTLRILVNTSDFNNIKVKASLALTVVEDFQKWLTNKEDKYRNYLVPGLKNIAFKLVTGQKNLQLIKLVSKVYEFESDKQMFLPFIKVLIEQNRFKDAAQYASALHVENEFSDPEVLLLPLILQNKNTIVEDFVRDYPELQRSLLTYLDNLLAPSKNMPQYLDDYINLRNIPDVQMPIYHTRQMAKLLARLIKKFDISADVCPNLNRKRGESALQFLINKRFVDGSLNVDCWREMAREAVGMDSSLQVEMVLQTAYYDPTEALYWAQTYNVPKVNWPWSVSNIDSGISIESNSANSIPEENWDEPQDDDENYHTFNLPKESIIIVDHPQSFLKFINHDLIGVSMVGIDAEWKPSFGMRKSELALIQIATENHVYIIDVTTLGSKDFQLWKQLSLALFENKDIVKLGFSLTHDIVMLRESLPALSNVRLNGQGFLDLHHLWDKLEKDYKSKTWFKNGKNMQSPSLSKLVELCMGKKLRKTDQFSNWERRPLRESQVTYAALDAYCLLEIYNVFADFCEKKCIPFYDICIELQHFSHQSPKKSSKRGNKKVVKTSQKSNENLKSLDQNCALKENHQVKISTKIPAHLWRVVCEPQLMSLANHLRMSGIDCLCLEFDQTGNECIKIALNESRCLLTKSSHLEQFVKCKPQFYQVMSNTVDEQLKEVLAQFNILVTEENIMSRCQICNRCEFHQIPSNIMWELCQRYSSENNYRNSSGASSNNWKNMGRYNQFNTVCSENLEFSKNLTNSRSTRTWFLSTDFRQYLSATTKYGARIQLEGIPKNAFSSILQFYVCESCGNVYWDGSHPERVIHYILENFIVRSRTEADTMCSNNLQNIPASSL